MRHGYTNVTNLVGSSVSKTYLGPDSDARAATERTALTRLVGRFPVPALLATSPASLTTQFISGEHGQDLIEDGFAEEVLAACGNVLRRLHSTDPAVVFDTVVGGVIVHGDFGPNNMLFDPADFAVTAVIDWEFCHVGDRIEDLAWCEWIARTHHPSAAPALPRLFQSYGWTPPWHRRRDFMVRRCMALEQFCRRWEPDGAGAAIWAERRERTETWQE